MDEYLQLEADLIFARGLKTAFRKLCEERQRRTGQQKRMTAHEFEIFDKIEVLESQRSGMINMKRLALAKDVEPET